MLLNLQGVVLMSKRCMHFYVVSIKNLNTNQDVTHNLRDILNSNFDNYCHENDGVRSLQLSKGESHVTMDILQNNDSLLFARIGKIKPNAEMQLRNFRTLASGEVLPRNELNIRGVEICTHFLLDYNYGIVGFVFGMSAPSANMLVNIVNEYSDTYNMSIENIVSQDTIYALTNRGSVLGKIKYSFALPDVRILEYVGLNQESIDALQDTNVAEIELVIKSEPRHPLSADTNVITKVINSLRQVCENQRVKKLSANGKTVNSAYQDYKFEERKISNSIDVELDKTVSGKIISKTPSELAEELFIKMRQNYLTNRTDIIRFANREEFYNE
jgi:hypothetical protein